MKKTKLQVRYSKGTDPELCRNCVNFRDSGGSGGHWCIKVAGIIDPGFWCSLFKRKGG